MNCSSGNLFRNALQQENPLQIVGAINAYSAILAEKTGYKALYLSGSGVATASYGLPDLGITTLRDVLEDARRICAASPLPLLVDIDTGFGGFFNIARTIKEMIQVGVAAVHIEDQLEIKRCGHRPGKSLVSTSEMVDRLKAAVDAKTDGDFVIMARTDAFASEGLSGCVERALAYIEAGAEMIFIEALPSLNNYQEFISKMPVPVLANITEFGKTPLFTVDELAQAGVSMILYPLSAFRAMSKAALEVYQTIKTQGTQKPVIDKMQTREELYQFLNYYDYESKIDSVLNNAHSKGE